MPIISLTKGLSTVVDARDFRRFGHCRWFAQSTEDGNHYAARRRGRKIELLHRLIKRALPGEYVDHKNGVTLYNRRANLRRCTPSQNNCNARQIKRRGRPNAPKGVCHVPELNAKNPWIAYINFQHKRKYLGYFPTALLAGAVRTAAEERLHGQFSYGRSRNRL